MEFAKQHVSAILWAGMWGSTIAVSLTVGLLTRSVPFAIVSIFLWGIVVTLGGVTIAGVASLRHGFGTGDKDHGDTNHLVP